MKLPVPPDQYSRDYEAQKNTILEQSDLQNHKRLTDLEIVAPQRLILRSPNGSRWIIGVSNAGAITVTAL